MRNVIAAAALAAVMSVSSVALAASAEAMTICNKISCKVSR